MKCKLSDFISFKNGKKRPIEEGTVPVYGGNGVLGYTNLFNNQNCVIIGRVGAYCGAVYYEANKCWVSDNAIVGNEKENADIKFIYYSLKTLSLNQRHIGTSQPLLTQEILNKIEVDLPDLGTQKKIAKILSALDDKIECNNQINKNLEEQAQALFKSWFIDFEPYGGKIPNDWMRYKLSDFLPVITGKKNANISSKTGKYPFFSCSQDIAWTENYSFEGDAILVAGNGDFNVKFYNGKFEAYQRTYVLIPYNSKYTSWLYYVVKYNLSEITSAARGSVIKFITKGNLEEFTFFAPKNLQNFDLVDTFGVINNIISTNIQENYKLCNIRDTLLPKLMSGELDVPDIDI